MALTRPSEGRKNPKRASKPLVGPGGGKPHTHDPEHPQNLCPRGVSGQVQCAILEEMPTSWRVPPDWQGALLHHRKLPLLQPSHYGIAV